MDNSRWITASLNRLHIMKIDIRLARGKSHVKLPKIDLAVLCTMIGIPIRIHLKNYSFEWRFNRNREASLFATLLKRYCRRYNKVYTDHLQLIITRLEKRSRNVSDIRDGLFKGMFAPCLKYLLYIRKIITLFVNYWTPFSNICVCLKFSRDPLTTGMTWLFVLLFVNWM